MIKVHFFNKTKEDTKLQEKLIRSIFSNLDKKETFNVIFMDNEQIREINLMYREIDKATDVISFPDKEDDYIGDIFISLERANEQALEYGHSYEREVGFLAVHGYLHLLGYDHHNETDEKIMIEKQNEILKLAKLERVQNE